MLLACGCRTVYTPALEAAAAVVEPPPIPNPYRVRYALTRGQFVSEVGGAVLSGALHDALLRGGQAGPC